MSNILSVGDLTMEPILLPQLDAENSTLFPYR